MHTHQVKEKETIQIVIAKALPEAIQKTNNYNWIASTINGLAMTIDVGSFP